MLKKNSPNERYADLTNSYPEQNEQPEYQAGVPRTAARRELEGETEVTQAPRPAPEQARAESVVDADSTFDGKYETGQDLRILGTVSGEILCRGLLTIERDAAARARIQAQDLQVRGRIEGDVLCAGRLLITATGVVSGTIKAATLVVEEGATVRGTVETGSDATLDAAAPAPIGRKEREEKGAAAAEEGGNGRSGRWNRASREVPSFALVSSEERAAPLDRN